MDGMANLIRNIGDICLWLIGSIWVLNWMNCGLKAIIKLRGKCKELKAKSKVLPESGARDFKNPENSVIT